MSFKKPHVRILKLQSHYRNCKYLIDIMELKFVESCMRATYFSNSIVLISFGFIVDTTQTITLSYHRELINNYLISGFNKQVGLS